MTATAKHLEARLKRGGNKEKALFAQRFFRTGPGEYGEGDRFLGYTVPEIRLFAREAIALTREDLATLLKSPWHEVRLLALIVLTKQASRLKTPSARAELARWVLAHRAGINNWDLVDVSIPTLIGGVEPSTAWIKTIRGLLTSPRLWDRRMAMLATLGWMRQGVLAPVFMFAIECLHDQEDLMHKATGWMLREAGKCDEVLLRQFLDRYRSKMPRTMLRYAIERFSPEDRRGYLAR